MLNRPEKIHDKNVNPSCFDFSKFFFSLKGRVSRLAFIRFMFTEKILIILISMSNNAFIASHNIYESAFIKFLLSVVSLILLWPEFSVTYKRLTDIGWVRWLAWLHFIPAIFLILVLFVNSNSFIGSYQSVGNIVHFARSIAIYMVLGFVFLIGIFPGSTGVDRSGLSKS